MKKKRIQLDFTPKELKTLYEIADKQDRSRKNFIETEIKKIIDAYNKEKEGK